MSTTDVGTAAVGTATVAEAPGPRPPRRFTPANIARFVLAVIAVGLVLLYIGYDTTADTVLKVVMAVGLSAVLFIGANKLFDLAYPRWAVFNALAGFAVGFVGFAVLENNGALRRLYDRIVFFEGKSVTILGVFGPYEHLGPYDLNPWLWGLIGGAAVGLVLFLLSAPRERGVRLAVSVIGFGAIGLLLFWGLRRSYRPSIDWPTLLICVAVGVAVLGGLRAARGPRELAPLSALSGGVIGYTVGAWGGGEIGDGNALGAFLATVVPGALVGLRIGLAPEATAVHRRAIDQRSRAWIFVVPALAFITGGLLLPLVRTAVLSLQDDRAENFIGLDNFGDLFTSKSTFNADNWTNLFTSRLFWIAVVVLLVAIGAGIVGGRRNHARWDRGTATPAAAIGVFFLAMGIFAVVRGTIPNNLWWVVVVTALATALGLAAAVLADRSKGENVAKSMIFLPMAISFVGAGIIWRFMYQPRPASKNQTGVLNALWVGLGELSVSNSIWHWLVALMMLVALIGFALLIRTAIVDEKGVMLGASVAAFIGLGYCFVRYLGGGLGGVGTNARGEDIAQPVLFLEDRPFNNVWLMVVLIWIQTGFAMVILSSAIKAVPVEFTEAAKVDGATESQIFWKITIPQIAPTVGVVITTLIITVMKVFDIVRVMTGGVNDTQVIANEMITTFGSGNFGYSSALAMVLFIAVLPVMYINIRRMRNS